MNKRLALVQREAPRAQHHWEAAIRSEPPRRYNIVFPDDEPVDLAEGDGEGVGSSPGAVFAVVDPAAAEPAGDAIATFLPEWPRTKGPPLEIRLLTPGE